MGFPLFALATKEHPFLALPGAALCGFAHGIIFPAMMALSLRSFPPSERGTASVLALFAQEIGGVAGMPLMGWLADRNFHYAFAAASAAAATTAVIYAACGERSSPSDRTVHVEDAAAAEAESGASHTTEIPAA